MLTVAQAAQLLGVRPATVRQWISRGQVRRTIDGRIRTQDLLVWWDQRNHEQARRRATIATTIRG